MVACRPVGCPSLDQVDEVLLALDDTFDLAAFQSLLRAFDAAVGSPDAQNQNCLETEALDDGVVVVVDLMRH